MRAKKIVKHPKFQNWGNLKFSINFWFSDFQTKYPNFGILGKKNSNFLII